MLLTPRLLSSIHQRSVAAPSCRRCTAVARACPKLIAAQPCKTRRPALRTSLHCRAIASGEDVDKITVDQLDLDDPFSHVEDVMRDFELKFASPNQPLTQVQPLLDSVTGLPVVDDSLVVVGVLSRKDVERAQQQGLYEDATVQQFMSSPPITVHARAHVGEAAAIMIAQRLHRLPVVDATGHLVGILSRSDVFKRALQERADQIKALTVEAPTVAPLAAATETPVTPMQEEKPTWVIKYLYDGDCSICRSLKALLQRQDGDKGRVCFVNIANSQYDPEEHAGISYEEAMETIHAIRASGEIITGPPALLALYDAVGLGWIAKLAALPVFALVVEALYAVVSKLRLPLGGAVDALLAAHRMKQVGEGVETCTDNEEECEAPEW